MNRFNTPSHWSRISIVFLLTLFMACAGTEEPVKKGSPGNTAASAELDFFDSSRFDSRLSASLDSGRDEVTARFVGPVTVNEIPERMDKWFFMIEKYEGTVALEPTGPEARGFLTDIISLTVGAYNAIKEKMTYDPARDYNAKVLYDPQTGIIERVVFLKKGAAGVE